MKVVLIIGGAVSGSTAVKKLTDEGIRCVVVEQNKMPYGKIEDGLPRWHEKQRINEYFKIDDIISHELVDFVPLTRICLLYTSPSPRDRVRSRMPSSA